MISNAINSSPEIFDNVEAKPTSFWKKAKKIMKNVVQASTLILGMTPTQTSAIKSAPELNSINDLSIMQNITIEQKKFNDKFLKIVGAETPKLETQVIVESKDNLPKDFYEKHEEGNYLGVTYIEPKGDYSVVINDKKIDSDSYKIGVDKNFYRESYIVANEIGSINYEKFLTEKGYIEPLANYQVKDPILNINVPYSTDLKSKNYTNNNLLSPDKTRELAEVAGDLNSIKSLLSKLDGKSVDPMILTLRMMDVKILAKDAKQYNLIREINKKVFKQVFGLDYNSKNLEEMFYTLNDIKKSGKIGIELSDNEIVFRDYQELFEKHFYAEVAKTLSEEQADELIAANIFNDKTDSNKTETSTNNGQMVDYIIKKSNKSLNKDTETSTNGPLMDYVDESKSNDSIIDASTRSNGQTFDYTDKNFKQDFNV